MTSAATPSDPPPAATGATRAGTVPPPRARRLLVSAALVALVAGLVNLPAPFEWDQTSFMLGGERLGQGGVIYRDWWDVKQPGVLWFFAAAGRGFGYHEVGAHALELLWQLALALAIAASLWRDDPRGRAAALAPLFTVALYWAVAGPWHLTQAETLAAFPLYLALIALGAHRPGAVPGFRAWSLAGLFAGVALLFKLAFAPIPAAFALIAARDRRRARGGASAFGALLLFAAFAAVPTALAVAQVERAGALEALRRAWFEEPAAMLAAARGTRVAALVDGIRWFALHFAPALALAFVGAAARHDRLRTMLVAWIVAGTAVILAQRVSWWQYHWLLIAVPVGVLAARGGAWLLARLEAARVPTAAVVVGGALLFAGSLAQLGGKAVLLAADGFARTPALRRQHQLRTSELYARIAADAAFLSSESAAPGPIFVIGDPAVYWVTGRRESLATPGIRFFERYGAADWARLAGELEARPPGYVFVQSEFLETLERPVTPAAPLRALLERGYVEVKRGPRGAWWRSRHASAASTAR